MKEGERYEYAGFQFVLMRVGGAWQMSPMDGQHAAAYKSKHARAALEQYMEEKGEK